MNYFAHGRHFIDNPYYLAGTAVPDWLNVSDRRTRVRSKHAAAFAADAEPHIAAIAQGIMQHHRDDAWFHETRAFAELQWQFTAVIRETLEPDDGLRPSFLGHILVEILLDATLVAADPSRLEAYYQAMDAIDGPLVEATVNRMSPRRCERLAHFVKLFAAERFLWDYLDDAKLLGRLNQVVRRVKLSPLPERFVELLPDARRQVSERQTELLTPEPNVASDDCPIRLSEEIAP
jgi:hypothetical protein